MPSDTPSGRIIAAAQAEKEITDPKGRKIRYRRLRALDRLHLFKAIGPENATNAPYVGMALLASSCTQIDDVPLPFPSKESEIDSAVSRLDDDGMDAIGAALVRDSIEEAGGSPEGEQGKAQAS